MQIDDIEIRAECKFFRLFGLDLVLCLFGS